MAQLSLTPAQEAATQALFQRLQSAVELALGKVFDRIAPDALLARVARKVHDKGLRRLIGQSRRAGVNVVLDELDKELESRGCRFVRYADGMPVQA